MSEASSADRVAPGLGGGREDNGDGEEAEEAPAKRQQAGQADEEDGKPKRRKRKQDDDGDWKEGKAGSSDEGSPHDPHTNSDGSNGEDDDDDDNHDKSSSDDSSDSDRGKPVGWSSISQECLDFSYCCKQSAGNRGRGGRGRGRPRGRVRLLILMIGPSCRSQIGSLTRQIAASGARAGPWLWRASAVRSLLSKAAAPETRTNEAPVDRGLNERKNR